MEYSSGRLCYVYSTESYWIDLLLFTSVEHLSWALQEIKEWCNKVKTALRVPCLTKRKTCHLCQKGRCPLCVVVLLYRVHVPGSLYGAAIMPNRHMVLSSWKHSNYMSLQKSNRQSQYRLDLSTKKQAILGPAKAGLLHRCLYQAWIEPSIPQTPLPLCLQHCSVRKGS